MLWNCVTWQVYVNERLEDSMTDSLVESKHIHRPKMADLICNHHLIFFRSFSFLFLGEEVTA